MWTVSESRVADSWLPFSVRTRESNGWSTVHHVLASDGEKILATVHESGRYGQRLACEFSAAPEMLAALQDLLVLAQDKLDPDRTRLFSGELVRARAAIAKATGRGP